MDKWKDLELEKMKVGSNRNARVFFEMQTDYDEKMSLQEKYNSKAAALYRDKVRFNISFIFLIFFIQLYLPCLTFQIEKIVFHCKTA